MSTRMFAASGLIAALLLSLSGCGAPRPVESIRERADWLYQRGDYTEAATEYGEIAERYPGDWRAQHMLGLSLIQTGDLTMARRSLELAHTHRPNDGEIADALAEVMFRQNDEPQLFAFLRQRAETTQSVHAYRRLAHYAMEMGDPDSARLALETAIILDDGQTVEPYLDSAAFAQRIGNMDLAVRRLRQALWINPNDDRIRAQLRALGEVPGPSIALPPGR